MKTLLDGSDSPARHVSVRQLRYFVTVADHRSYRRAAESLCVSQPPITKQLQALEKTLGVALLKRSRRRVELTAAGEAFYVEARILLRGLERVCDTIRAFHTPIPRTFTIGMADDFIYGPHLERLFAAAKAGGVRIETSVALSPALETQVARGMIDAALINLPLSNEPTGLAIRPIAPSRICLIVPRNHPLASLEHVHASVLQDIPLIMCPESPANAFSRQCEKLFVAGGVTPVFAERTTCTAILEVLVERGYGVGIASEHSVRPRHPSLRSIPFEGEESRYGHAIAYATDRASNDLMKLLGALEPERPTTRSRARVISKRYQ